MKFNVGDRVQTIIQYGLEKLEGAVVSVVIENPHYIVKTVTLD